MLEIQFVGAVDTGNEFVEVTLKQIEIPEKFDFIWKKADLYTDLFEQRDLILPASNNHFRHRLTAALVNLGAHPADYIMTIVSSTNLDFLDADDYGQAIYFVAMLLEHIDKWPKSRIIITRT